MDSETGESVRDQETGEMPARAEVNLETGESEINHSAPEKQNTTRKFRIPNTNQEPKNHVDITSSDIVPCIVVLFSATLFLNPFFVACLGVLECCLHIWTHKKNKKSLSKGFYYQSPFHLFLKEYCGSCIEERSKNKITRIQDKRNYKLIKYSIDCSQGIVM